MGSKRIFKANTENIAIAPNILEIGCGLGYLTYSLNREGYKAKGLDISQEAVNKAIQNYGNYYTCANLFEYAINHEKEYDILILTEVIEHLNDINSFMKSLKKLLRYEGKIILTTPNKSYYPTTVLWASDLPPVHCWWLSEESIKLIALKLNMAVSFLDFENYYKKHKSWVNIEDIRIPITPPVFDKNGILIDKTNGLFKIVKEIKNIFKNIKLIKYLYDQARHIIDNTIYSTIKKNKNILFPKNRGPVLCAILQIN